jgi:hypothetical protein
MPYASARVIHDGVNLASLVLERHLLFFSDKLTTANRLNNSMELSPSLQANTSSANKKFPVFYGLPLVPFLSQMNIILTLHHIL